MKIDKYQAPTSRFLSVDKDMAKMSEMFYNNDRLCRLLFRKDPSALSDPNLTEAEKVQLFAQKYIRFMPKVTVDLEVPVYIVVGFDNFVPTLNPLFRDNTISISIFCKYDQWMLENGMQRPYRIAAEIDTMLSNAKFSGIGTLQFTSASQLMIDGDFGGIGLEYLATHGGDDEKHFENLADEIKFLEEELSKQEQ